MEQMHPRPRAGGLPASVDLLQYGAQRSQAGSTCDHEDVGKRPALGKGELLANRRGQPYRVTSAQPADDRGGDKAASDRLDVELQAPRGLRSVCRTEVAPQAGPVRDLHGHRLPGSVGKWRPGRDLYHGNLNRAPFDPDYLRLPRGRRDRLIVLSYHRETTVVTTQLLEERHNLVQLVDVRHHRT